VIERLTKAQREFLLDTVHLGALGFSVDALTGSETEMARRLEAAGYLAKTLIGRVNEYHWQITPAGRALLLSLKDNANG